MTSRRILVISPDLMVTSRLAGLASSCHASITTLRSPDAAIDAGPYDLVLLDLQGVPGDAAGLVDKARSLIAGLSPAAGGDTRLIAFGPHVAKQRLDEAKAAGAADAISRGELLGAFPALVSRWCPPI
jgi:CheY-like chemotaxis protein